jgi:putative membrane protein
MSELLDLYATQLRVLRHWRGGPGALAKRLVIVVLVSVIGFVITEWLDPFITMTRLLGAVEMVLIMALLNALVRPIVLAFVAPRSLVATGIVVLAAQVVVFYLAAELAPNVHVGDVVRDLMGGRATVFESQSQAEGAAFVNSLLSEVTRTSGIGPAVARAAFAGRTRDGVVDLDMAEVQPPADEASIAVVGSGNLGLVWFMGHDHLWRSRSSSSSIPASSSRSYDTLASRCCWSARVRMVRSRSGTRAHAISTRTASKARTRRRHSGRTPS